MKKQIWYALLTVLLCLAMVFSLAACDNETETTTADDGTSAAADDGQLNIPSEGLEYTINSDGQSCHLSGIGIATDTDIVVPETHQGYPVTSIGFYALSRADITSITIPNSVTSIDSHAFYYCTYLKSITIPDSVKSIGYNAFSQCYSLTSVTIPNSVTSIGNEVFVGCSSLTSITIPDRVKSIGDYAFKGCKSLTSVTIPKSVTNIGLSAFSNCYKLTSIYYTGTPAEWDEITIRDNTCIPFATRYYYSETEPADTENLYWHYVEGVPTAW